MHWFIDPVKNHYADFSGRASRQEYWMFFLVTFGITILVSIIAGLLGVKFLVALWQLAILLPSIAILVRRLHDVNKSGWLVVIGIVLQLSILPAMFNLTIIFVSLLGIATFVYSLILLIFLVRKGDAGENKYGLPSTGVGELNTVPVMSDVNESNMTNESTAVPENKEGM